jgi:hypothetical protein
MASSKLLSRALYVLVPLAFLNLGLTRPASSYDKTGPVGVPVLGAVLMLAVFILCAANWRNHRLVAALGFFACFLWLAITLLPVL